MDREATFSHWRNIALIITLATLTLTLFGPAIGFDYINLDDPQYVFGNSHVLTGLNLENIRWAFTQVYEAWWLPALWISYMVDATLLGPEPWGFHLVNILLHTANVLLLFWVLRRATGASWTSAFAAALFAIHPLRIESVAWITERKDVLSGLFFFLCLLAHLRQVERPSVLRFWTLQIFMLLGLMAKSILVVLPVLLLLLDYWPLRRASVLGGPGAWVQWRPLLAEKWLLFGLSAVFVVLTLVTHRTVGSQNFHLSMWNRLTLVAPNYGNYLAKFFWPDKLSIYYPPNYPPLLLRVLAPLGLLGVTALAWRRLTQCPALLVGWLWFLLALSPVIRGIRFDEQSPFSDRYTYLPAIGLSILLAFGFSQWFSNRPKGRILLWFLAIGTLGACSGLTAYNLRFWRNSDTLAQRLWELDPGNSYAITGRGNTLQKQERWAETLEHYQKVVADSPQNARYRMLLALALVNMDRLPEAFTVLEEGLHDAVDEPELTYARGLAHLQDNQPGQARIHLAQAVAGLPQTLAPLCRLELARACFEDGDPTAANEQFHLIPDYDSSRTYGYADLMPVYAWIWDSGERPRALRYFRKLTATYPENPAILNNVAWILATTTHSPAPPEEALELARQACSLGTVNHPGLLDTLAVAQANAGDFEAAVHTAEQALALVPNLPQQAIFRQQLQARIDLYRKHQPYREEAATRLF